MALFPSGCQTAQSEAVARPDMGLMYWLGKAQPTLYKIAQRPLAAGYKLVGYCE